MTNAEQEGRIDALYADIRPLVVDQHPATVLAVCGSLCGWAIKNAPPDLRAALISNFVAALLQDVSEYADDAATVN